MNPDKSQDIIQHAFTGADDGSVLYNNQLLYTPSDTFNRAYTLDLRGNDNIPCHDRVKLSGVHNFILRILGRVVGGTEDCIDVNHCKDCNIFVDEVEPQGRHVLTCKGGSTNILLSVSRQLGRSTEVDYDYGNKSDQSRAKTTGCTLSIGMATQTITVRCLNADAPAMTDKVHNSTKWLFPSPHAWYHGIVITVLKLIRVL